MARFYVIAGWQTLMPVFLARGLRAGVWAKAVGFSGKM
jgi:hypothetical protein